MMEKLIQPKKTQDTLTCVYIKEILSSPYRMRSTFDEASIRALAQSIRECGLISPITLRRLPKGGYALIAGERRLRALRLLGRTQTEALVLNADEARSRAVSLVENIQRENLTFFEEARAVKELLRATGQTQDAVAHTLGRSPSFVANRLRLLKLPENVQSEITKGNLSERHARALLALQQDAEKQLLAAKEAAERSLNVRDTERLIETLQKKKPEKKIKTFLRDERLFLNAVKDTVKRLTETGLNATCRVEENEESLNVIVSLSRKHG